MMTEHQFCDHCPGCRPALFDPATGKVFPPDSPTMVAVNKVWNTDTTYAQRKAFIEVTLHNSRATPDMVLMSEVMAKFEKALK